MTKILFFSFLLLTALSIKAHGNSDLQSWNTFTLSGSINNFLFAVQTEARYSLDEREVYEEHFKPYIGYNSPIGEIGFVFSFLADEVFTKTFEKRYALQYSTDLFKNSNFIYNLRFRQEFRDFSSQSTLAHRFRIRNEFELTGLKVFKWTPYTNSEFNIYTNETFEGPKGFSSHRFILGVVKDLKEFELGFSFTHNFKKSYGQTEIRYSVGLNIEVEL